MSVRTLQIKVKEDVQVSEQLSTYKRWFNGIKHFFTIKVLPPRR